MKTFLKFLKWQFVVSGIMYAEEERGPKRSLRRGLKRLFTGGVQYGVPDAAAFTAAMKVGLQLRRYRCKVCGIYFWGWRKRRVCWKWSCAKQA